MPADSLLTVAEVQQRLRFAKPDAVYSLIGGGHLHATNVSPGSGRPRWLIAEADLKAFLAGRRNVPASMTPTPVRRRRRERVTRYF